MNDEALDKRFVSGDVAASQNAELSTGPIGLPLEIWEAIPEDLQPEALDRASWIIFRGESIHDALIVAMEGMASDLGSLRFEPLWSTVRRVADIWPVHSRMNNGRFKIGILEAASFIEENALLVAQQNSEVDVIVDKLRDYFDEECYLEAVEFFHSHVEFVKSALGLNATDSEEYVDHNDNYLDSYEGM